MTLENTKNVNALAEAATMVPALHPIDNWDDVIVIPSDNETDDVIVIPIDDEADDVIVISSDDETDEKPVSVIGRKRVYALIDESDEEYWSNGFLF
ncbi:hypothetical protein Tco_0637307 [Tanacetum coccineum]